ncbi:MAG: triple tyrosine motif-containing protein [Flavobacterium sp.]|nr:triple tyrosine motif-containing protein [Flavobacterium sp.]
MKKTLALVLIVAICLSSISQNTIGLPQITNYNNNEYKAGTQTWDIKQDKLGRMYFANNDGLLIYDGNYWNLFTQPNKSILRSIAIVKDRIYAGGQNEIGYFSPDEQGKMYYTSLKKLIPESHNRFTDIWDIEVYNNGIFFRSWDQIFEYKDDVITAFTPNSGWRFMKLAGNKLIAQDFKSGLFQFSNNNWVAISNKNHALNFEITSIVPLKNDSLLISTLQNGFFTFRNGNITKNELFSKQDILQSHIYSFERINNNQFVVATTSQGCYIINENGQIIQHISLTEGLQNNNVLSVFIDNDKNIWTGLNNGISHIAFNSAIKYIKPGQPNELSGYSAHIFNNKLFIATSDGTYSVPIFSEANNDLSFSKGHFSLVQNTDGQGWRLAEINHQLLLGHHKGFFQIENNIAKQMTFDAGFWSFVPLSLVYPSKFVIAGSYAGLSMLEYNDNKLIKTLDMKGAYVSRRFLALDNNNEVWSSHPYLGVYKITLATNNQSFTSQLFTEKDGLPSTLRNTVFRVKNRVVFTTEKGIYEFDYKLNKFIHSPLLYNILGETSIQYLNEDANGRIWFCSNKKLGVITFNETDTKYSVTYFPEITGKMISGFENIYPYSKENIFISSNTGVIHLNYEKYITLHPKLNVLLTQVKTFDKMDSVIYGGFDYLSDNAIANKNSKSSSQFSTKSTSLHFEFSSTTYNYKNNIKYSYLLKGFNRNWSEWTSKTEKDYTNLPSGTYIFSIKSQDNLGNESAVVSYKFIILTPWYLSYYAYTFYSLFIFFGIYQIYKWQKKKFALQQIKFEEEQKKLIYIHQLEVEKSEKEIIELQNEKLANEVTYKTKKLADASMHLVERSDSLLKIKDELQQLFKKTGGNHDVKKTIALINDIEKNNTHWNQFAVHFDEINNDFLKKLKNNHPNLTNVDLKICTYLQLNLSSKEIAQLMNISERGVELGRYRLRKKLNLSRKDTLTDFLNDIRDK